MVSTCSFAFTYVTWGALIQNCARAAAAAIFSHALFALQVRTALFNLMACLIYLGTQTANQASSLCRDSDRSLLVSLSNTAADSTCALTENVVGTCCPPGDCLKPITNWFDTGIQPVQVLCVCIAVPCKHRGTESRSFSGAAYTALSLRHPTVSQQLLHSLNANG